MTAPSTVPTRSSDTESVIKALLFRSSGRIHDCAMSWEYSQADRPEYGAGKALQNSGDDHQRWKEGMTVSPSIF